MKIFKDNISDWVTGCGMWKNQPQNKKTSKMEKIFIEKIYPEYKEKTQWTTDFGENKFVQPILELLYDNVKI